MRPLRLGARARIGLSAAALAVGGALAAAQALQPPPSYAGVLVATPVPLDPAEPERTGLGGLSYAGGLVLTATGTALLTGVSGLEVEATAENGIRFLAVTDGGDIARFTARLDAAGRLVGADGLQLARLRDLDGALLPDKRSADAEDLVVTPDGAVMVSFEQRHRVWRYADPFGPGAATAAAFPDRPGLKPNRGVEALARLPDGQLAVGAEDGRLWLCPNAAAGECRRTWAAGGPGMGMLLTALRPLGDSGQLLALYRAYDPIQGMRARLAVVTAESTGAPAWRTLASLERPLTVDNMEALAVTPAPDGGPGWRIYLASDDGFPDDARTLLLAFDWRPAG